MTTPRHHWTALFGAWSDHDEHLPLVHLWDQRSPLIVANDEAMREYRRRRMTVDEAMEAAAEFAFKIMQGYRSPSEHDDFHTPAEDLLQSMLMELFVRDNRTARVLSRGIDRYIGSGESPVEFRLRTERCEFQHRTEEWPFVSRCIEESVTEVPIGDDENICVCQTHWNDYLAFKVNTRSLP